MEKPGSEPVCSEEALNLLNCVTESVMDEAKCLALLHSLRQCVLNKKVKKFSIDNQDHTEEKPSEKKI